MARAELPGKGLIQTLILLGSVASGLWGSILAIPHQGELTSEVFQVGLALISLAGVGIATALVVN